jgi:hypothetical protein
MEYTFFGVQVLLKAFHNDPFQRELHEIIARAPAQQTLLEKRKFWKQVAARLEEAVPAFEMGYWDLVRGSKAEAEFESWTSELEGAAATEKEELGAAADEVNRLSSDKYYVLVTCVALVALGSNSDATLGDRCDIPEAEWWNRFTFARLLGTFPLLNFGTVQADAVYLLPGNDRDGLSMEDVHGGGYEYLKPLA